ncbi:MAG: hypothetical protein J5616_04905 [Bacteroidaceae bacterium]|nr:hypothetical protein [Bacteroidaceae bacterium]
MKKFLLSLAVMAMGASLLTGCSDDDSNDSNDTSPGHFLITKGVFVINNGSSYLSIDGSLTYWDCSESYLQSDRDVYRKVNGRSLGGTPNDVIVYGQKVYIAGSDENAIFVLDVRTCKELKQVSTTDLLGDDDGRNPRRIAVYDGNVYFTTQGGYVAAIDTTDFHLQQKYQVGSFPEGLTFDVGGSTLYVANSDWSRGNGSISKIDITTGNVTEIKHDKVTYPQEIVVAGDVLYVLDRGYYNDDWTQQLEAGVYMISGNDAKLVVPNATGMAVVGDMIYTYNDPYGGSGATYSVFDIRSNNLSTLNLSGDSAHRLISPCAISVDQLTGNIYIASRQLDPDTGYPSESLPGFVNIYRNSGEFLESLDTGVEPHKIAFSYGFSKILVD